MCAAAAIAIAAILWGAWLAAALLPPRLSLMPAIAADLVGWTNDDIGAALPAFVSSCSRFLKRKNRAPFDALTHGGGFGRVGDWRPLCTAAMKLPPDDNAAARRFFAAGFLPLLAGNYAVTQGLFTGYYQVTLKGSRRREGPYQTPLYRRPPDPTRYSRADIDKGALRGKGLELAWVDSPFDALAVQIQGSGRVKLPDGKFLYVGYDGSNGRRYVAIGRLLVERGIIAREALTMAAIRAWMAKHPREGAALERENPSYVFFRQMRRHGAVGAEDVVLTPGRSLAVDPRFIPLGVPVWLDLRQKYAPRQRLRRLVVAQDVGGAIKGPVRGDLFWGAGTGAAAGAGAMNATGEYFILVPRAVAARRALGW